MARRPPRARRSSSRPLSRLATAGADAAPESKRARFRSPTSSRLFFLLDTLDNLVKGGRAGKAAGLAASLLNIKPVLTVNSDGIIEPFKKVRGRQQAIASLAEHMAKDSRENGRMRVRASARVLPGVGTGARGRHHAAGADVEWDSHGAIGAVIGVYTGPGAIGCAYYPIG